MNDDFAAFGLTEVSPEPQDEKNEFEIFPDNEIAVSVFLQVLTQWVVAGMGGIIGLNYQSVQFVLDLNKVDDKLDCFTRIRVLEQKALKIFDRNRGDQK